MISFSQNLCSVNETAKKLRWSTKRVRCLIKQGLPVVQIGRQSLINQETLDDYLRNLENVRGV